MSTTPVQASAPPGWAGPLPAQAASPPAEAEPPRTEARALVADLRHLQGFAATMGQERRVSSLTPEDAKLSKHAAKLARLLKQVADTFERKLAAGVA